MGLLNEFTQAVDARKRYYGNIVRGLLDNPQAIMEQLRAQNAENVTERARQAQETRSVMPGIAEPAQRAAFDEAMNMGLLGITAYHGSPHKFDKFDMSKIGTGEGAQAYGHGLYFAESPAVAKQYQKELSAQLSVGGKPLLSKNKIVGTTGNKDVDDVLMAYNGDVDFAISQVKEWRKDVANIPKQAALYDKQLAALEGLRGKVKFDTAGNLYKVDIPDEAVAKMLDWDKPLSQQPEAVRKALEPIIAPLRKEAAKNVGGWGDLGKAYNIDNELTGQQIVGLMRTKIPSVSNIIGGGGPVVTNKLRELGIPGIRYLDGGSRGKGNGTSNFVLFDDQLPKIIGRE